MNMQAIYHSQYLGASRARGGFMCSAPLDGFILCVCPVSLWILICSKEFQRMPICCAKNNSFLCLRLPSANSVALPLLTGNAWYLHLLVAVLGGGAVVVDMKIGKPCAVLKSYSNFEWSAVVFNKTFFAIAKQTFSQIIHKCVKCSVKHLNYYC